MGTKNSIGPTSASYFLGHINVKTEKKAKKRPKTVKIDENIL
jgi:hypothetical protein